MFRLLVAVLLTVQATVTPVAATTYAITKYYPNNDCSSVPGLVFASEDSACTNVTCSNAASVTCVSDYVEPVQKAFGSSEYIMQAVFNDQDCSEFNFSIGFEVTDSCDGTYSKLEVLGYYYTATLNADGSASLIFSSEPDCSSSSDYSPAKQAESIIQSHACIATDANTFFISGQYYQWYSSDTSSDDSGISTGAIAGIVVGCVVLVLIVIALILYRQRAKKSHTKNLTTTLQTGNLSTLEAALTGQTGLWTDDVITAKRIPRDKVQMKKIISRGAYGEVFAGVYNGQQVAIKMLLPATRGSLEHVNDFLSEAKMTATMDHPHIVSFVGVAWDSLSDLCVVLEFMDGGDLRTLLDKYKTSNHPVGFDREKATIALHVCHALTYLHSLLPPVIHRDLKSRNILLNKAMEAKLTDFGISRERMDQTMTAGVGTSLWMAPEVMLGEKYGVKADIFSFGVVLSELDVHTLPYAQAKQMSLDTNGRQMADATLLQKVTMGSVRVEFSDSNPPELVELGCACVSVDPNDRPTAAEALYRLQMILSQ